MEITTYCQCACANCGQVIDYRASRAGEVVECPKCGDKSVLPEPEKLIMIEVFGPPIPASKNCPVCGTQMPFMLQKCEVCETARKRKRRRLMIDLAALVIVLLVIGGTAELYRNHSAAKKRALEEARAQRAEASSPKSGGTISFIGVADNPKADSAPPVSSGSRIIMEQPRPRGPKSTNDFHVGRFSLEKRRGSDLVIAVGDIQNISENTHEQLRADLDILDKSGAKIGTVSDFFTELGPHQTWHYVATVTDSNAMSLRFAGIKESD